MQTSKAYLDTLQKTAVGVMTLMVLVTFLAANLHALLWQSSEWLVSTVLPAVVVNLTNDERADNAAAPLRRNATLDAAAKLKAEHMAQNEYFAHYSPTGVSPWHWFDEVGYVYAHAGENLAIHFTDSTEVVEAWMNSPTHRKNIVDQKFTEIGVGTAQGTFEGYDTVYVVQLFGAPAQSPEALVKPAEIDTVTATPTAPAAVFTSPPAPVDQVAPVTTPPTAVVTDVSDENDIASSSTSRESTVPTTTVLAAASLPTTALMPAETMGASQVTNAESVSSKAVAIATLTPQATELELKPSTMPVDTVVVRSPVIATSSGLAVAQIETLAPHAGVTFASIATKPNVFLEVMYVTLGTVVVLLLVTSMYVEARRQQYRQVVYSVLLLCAMSGLWLVHSWLTGGAVIV